jgi:tRNA pseudouridine55 synthase
MMPLRGKGRRERSPSRETMPPHGVLNLNKPSGVTSRRVVDRVQRLARPAKAGHAGTLDPLASGVLVVCVGAATRLIEYVQRMPKRYTATFLLGRESPTDDVEGEVAELTDPPVPEHEQLRTAAQRFVGRIEQRPPAYSAVKVRGQRAYDLARRGEQVKLEARPVTVHRIDVVDYTYPRVTLDVLCGSGTYIRSLGRDLAESLGTKAVMSALERTAIGEFRVDEAVDPDQLTPEDWLDHLLPSLAAVGALMQIELSDEQVEAVRHGRTIALPAGLHEEAELAAVDAEGRLVAMLTRRGGAEFRPSRVLMPD